MIKISINLDPAALKDKAAMSELKGLLAEFKGTGAGASSIGEKGPLETLYNEKIGRLKMTAEEKASGLNREEIAKARLTAENLIDETEESGETY